jgi:hypothetical protein
MLDARVLVEAVGTQILAVAALLEAAWFGFRFGFGLGLGFGLGEGFGLRVGLGLGLGLGSPCKCCLRPPCGISETKGMCALIHT